MNAAELAQAMLDWREKRTELDVIEDRIRQAVLELGKTQTVGDVRASYAAGKRTFGYQQAVDGYIASEPEDLECFLKNIESNSRTVTTVDYKSVCDAYGLNVPVVRQGKPSVNISLI